MVEQGFVEEVEALRSRGDLHLGMPSIRAVGYRQVWEYLDGSSTREEMVERGIIATRQLAKRQFTWLRSWGGSLAGQFVLRQSAARIEIPAIALHIELTLLIDRLFSTSGSSVVRLEH